LEHYPAGFGYADAMFLSYHNFTPGQDASGHRVPFTSKFSANAAVQYRLPLTIWMGVMTRWEVAYKSSLFYDVANTIKEPDYVVVNARLGIEAERWDVFVFARNLLEEQYRTMGLLSAALGPIGTPADPLTYGVQARIRF
jgi:iron complex outermembrane recepter protein